MAFSHTEKFCCCLQAALVLKNFVTNILLVEAPFSSLDYLAREALTAEQSPSPWSMAVLTWLTVDDDALLMVCVAGGGQLVVQHVQQLSQLSSLPLLILWLY